MLSQIFYLLRSRADGQYLVARGKSESDRAVPSFLLLFNEYADALSYLNTHAAEVADRFAIETLPGGQLKSLVSRWSFTGVGVVQDPLVPQIEFLLIT